MTDSAESDTENLLEDISARARTSKRMAWLLDECIRVPGTDFKFGLDPIIGMIPGGGEFVATMAGATVLGESAKKGIPFRTLFKMAGNMLLNALVGLVPGVGDLFSVWFKSNKRNYELLTQFLDDEDGNEARGGWWPMMMVVSLVGMVLIVNVLVVLSLGFAAHWLYTQINEGGMLQIPSM